MRRATLLGLLLAAACQSQVTSPAASSPPSTEPEAPQAPPLHLTLTVRDPSGDVGPFVLDDLETLAIEVQGVHLGVGDHALRLDVTGPDGTLYAQFPATLTSDRQGHGSASISLQVRGTTIETYRQLGTWQVVAVLDGTPLAASSVEVVDAAQ